MSENSTETTTPAPTPSRIEETKTPKNAYEVFEKGDAEVSGNGEVTAEMRAHSWNNGYAVINSKKNGDWSTKLRDNQ